MTNDSAGADFWYIINIEYSFVLRNYESLSNAVLYWWAYKCYKLWTPFFIKKKMDCGHTCACALA